MTHSKGKFLASASVLGVAGTVLMPIAASATEYYEIQRNIKGHAGGHNGYVLYGAPAKADFDLVRALGKLPKLVSVNEICASQVYDLLAYFRSNGSSTYNVVFNPAKTAGLQSPCQGAYGNAVFYLDSVDPAPYTKTYATSSQHPNDTANGEWRNMICVNTSKYIGCTTHLTSRADATALVQMGDYFGSSDSVFSNNSSGKGQFYAGDFNVTPSQAGSTAYASYRRETDRCDVTIPYVFDQPTFGAEKIDYLFGRRPPGYCDTVDQAIVTPLGSSDHKGLIARLAPR